MELTEDQQQIVAGWIDEGMSMAEIQSSIAEQFGLSITYQDVHFLLDDLNLSPHNEPENPAEDLLSSSHSGQSEDDNEELGDAATGGGLTVEVDKVMKPGYVISGKVTFSDGMNADWSFDQMGRLGLAPAKSGYEPSASDIQQFQQQLQSHLQKKGL